MKKLIALSLLALAPFAAQAANYDYVEGGYADFDYDDGIFVGGSFDVAPNIRILGEFNSLDNLDITELGVGYHTGVADKVDVYGDLKFVDIDADDGLGLTGGVRFAVAPRFELGGGINYYNFDSGSETNIFVNGLFRIADRLDIMLEVEDGDVLDKMQLGVRYNF